MASFRAFRGPETSQDVGKTCPGLTLLFASFVAARLRNAEAGALLSVPLRWCALHGSNGVMTLGWVGVGSTND